MSGRLSMGNSNELLDGWLLKETVIMFVDL